MKTTPGASKGKALQAGIDAVEAKIKGKDSFQFANMVERDLMTLNGPARSYLRNKGIEAIYSEENKIVGYEKLKKEN